MSDGRTILRTGLRPRRGPGLLALVSVALSLGLTAPLPQPGDDPESQIMKVKAAYLRTLSAYVEWPAHTFADEKAAVIIGVVGTDPFGPILDQSIRGATAKKRPLEVRRIKTLPAEDAPRALQDAVAADLRGCHLLYVSRSEERRVDRIQVILRGAHVLTVSDIPQFARDGGVIELVLEKEKVRFHINRRAAERAELRIDSKLLSLARKVYDEDR